MYIYNLNHFIVFVHIWEYFSTPTLQPKCHQYWPDKVNGSFTYGNVSVTFLQEEVFAEYTIRSLALKMVNINGCCIMLTHASVQIEASSEAKSVSLEVKHFHFTVWPDHGVPKYATAILGFHKRVCKNHKRKRGSPLLVHCRYNQLPKICAEY